MSDLKLQKLLGEAMSFASRVHTVPVLGIESEERNLEQTKAPVLKVFPTALLLELNFPLPSTALNERLRQEEELPRVRVSEAAKNLQTYVNSTPEPLTNPQAALQNPFTKKASGGGCEIV
ncbi:hypothetical protein HK097_008822 [Rhizophlyctis rosea]|uniref:G protein gamma domain-containing protein n=1 Tax=Rhizophlyctis rosea TaxID=64517 RepID=A0AAD5X3Q3_9FUNG|nr:hypothetical protein HK097_008822 [Rhizophlyctis rosea]